LCFCFFDEQIANQTVSLIQIVGQSKRHQGCVDMIERVVVPLEGHITESVVDITGSKLFNLLVKLILLNSSEQLDGVVQDNPCLGEIATVHQVQDAVKAASQDTGVQQSDGRHIET
jgi:hypothetical protein